MLSIEAALQQLIPLNSIVYYIFVFSGAVVYYTKAYISQTTVADVHNRRSVWYIQYHSSIKISQIAFTIIFGITGLLLLRDIFPHILRMNITEWLIIALFPIVAALYYGLGLPNNSRFTLRNMGWIKPFVIGFVWGGLVTIYPIMFHDILKDIPYEVTFFGTLLFIKNFMYITVLCIMFDIKDYAADHNRQLKTFVVRFGLRRTIFYILIPLASIGMATFLIFATSRHFPLLRILINTVPFILLIIVAYSMHRRKSILYYLAVIDGLMLVKACCGIIGITLIK